MATKADTGGCWSLAVELELLNSNSDVPTHCFVSVFCQAQLYPELFGAESQSLSLDGNA